MRLASTVTELREAHRILHKRIHQALQNNDTIEISYGAWHERDRHMLTFYIVTPKYEKELVTWVDEDYQEAIEDGFINPRDIYETFVNWCRHGAGVGTSTLAKVRFNVHPN